MDWITQVVYHGLHNTGCRLIKGWITQVGCLAATLLQQSDQLRNLLKPRAKMKLTGHGNSEQWHLHLLHGLVRPWEASSSRSFAETGG